jgi:hypothetical protein
LTAIATAAALRPPLPERPSTVERAFELARSGECRGIPALVAALKSECHEAVDAHLAGSSIRRDLRKLWEAAGPG